MSVLLRHFRATCDPFFVGHSTGEYLTLGYALTEGLVFPFPGGGVVLRRRRLYPDVGPWTFCGFARPADSTIRNMPGFPHEADMAYQYSSAVVLGNGFAGRFSEPVRVDFDGGGARITPPLPMFPRHVTATPTAGGRFLVEWEYDPFGHGAWPADFQVFAGADAGSVDFGTPLVDAVSGLNFVKTVGASRRYRLATAAFAHGVTKVFVVRGRNSAGVAEKNTVASLPKIARTTTASVTSVEVTGMRK